MKKTRLLVLVLVLLAALWGCAADRSTPAPEENTTPQPRLQFSVVESEDPGYTLISPEDLGDDTVYMAYGSLTQVDVTLEGVAHSLPDAIRDGLLTVEELFAFARLDARDGFCEETYTSRHGLTHFGYTYPQCKLHLTYDVYETPDGNRTLINQLYVYNLSTDLNNVESYYVDEESPWGYFLDREDWGLTFEASAISPTGITLTYTQRQAQEFGELTVDDYRLYAADTDTHLASSRRSDPGFPLSLSSDGSGEITLTWPEITGGLQPGEYYLKLTVSDHFDASSLHPLTADYHDRQSYHVTFTLE